METKATGDYSIPETAEAEGFTGTAAWAVGSKLLGEDDATSFETLFRANARPKRMSVPDKIFGGEETSRKPANFRSATLTEHDIPKPSTFFRLRAGRSTGKRVESIGLLEPAGVGALQ